MRSDPVGNCKADPAGASPKRSPKASESAYYHVRTSWSPKKRPAPVTLWKLPTDPPTGDNDARESSSADKAPPQNIPAWKQKLLQRKEAERMEQQKRMPAWKQKLLEKKQEQQHQTTTNNNETSLPLWRQRLVQQKTPSQPPWKTSSSSEDEASTKLETKESSDHQPLHEIIDESSSPSESDDGEKKQATNFRTTQNDSDSSDSSDSSSEDESPNARSPIYSRAATQKQTSEDDDSSSSGSESDDDEPPVRSKPLLHSTNVNTPEPTKEDTMSSDDSDSDVELERTKRHVSKPEPIAESESSSSEESENEALQVRPPLQTASDCESSESSDSGSDSDERAPPDQERPISEIPPKPAKVIDNSESSEAESDDSEHTQEAKRPMPNTCMDDSESSGSESSDSDDNDASGGKDKSPLSSKPSVSSVCENATVTTAALTHDTSVAKNNESKLVLETNDSNDDTSTSGIDFDPVGSVCSTKSGFQSTSQVTLANFMESNGNLQNSFVASTQEESSAETVQGTLPGFDDSSSADFAGVVLREQAAPKPNKSLETLKRRKTPRRKPRRYAQPLSDSEGDDDTRNNAFPPGINPRAVPPLEFDDFSKEDFSATTDEDVATLISFQQSSIAPKIAVFPTGNSPKSPARPKAPHPSRDKLKKKRSSRKSSADKDKKRKKSKSAEPEKKRSNDKDKAKRKKKDKSKDKEGKRHSEKHGKKVKKSEEEDKKKKKRKSKDEKSNTEVAHKKKQGHRKTKKNVP